MWWLATMAMAGPSEVSEEVVVYGDPFARWDHTRWDVQTELMLPLGIDLASRDDAAIVAETVQIHAVLLCDKDAKIGRKRFEVSCEVEDIGLRVVSTRWGKPADQPLVARILDQLDARMTGMDVQLQVHADGRVPNIDLEGLGDARDVQDREHDESLRAMMGQVMAAFHLQVPDQGTRLGIFEEPNPTLMRIPGLVPSAGSTRMVHGVGRRGNQQIIQTVGEGTMALPIPNGKMQNPFNCPPEGGMCADLAAAFPEGNLLDLDATFSLEASGVAVFDRETGILGERIWEITGNGRVVGAGVVLPPYVNRGRLTLLGTADRPDVGPTLQVAAPGGPDHGLPPWIPLEA